ncbi:MAG: hypothetical protein LBI39_02480 [Puniceicoccales bacterium]|jgi:D-alanine-D-alanine ligase|nr:hypothetical protein [Puniceicoccales bacterium]
MRENCEVVILCGANSPERSVSLRSGRNVAALLKGIMPLRLIELQENIMPTDLDPRRSIIFPLVHGDFGEDGKLQKMLDGGNFVYIGSGNESMELTIDKARTKNLLASFAIPTLPHRTFRWNGTCDVSLEKIFNDIGGGLFFKPNCGGSSIDCFRCDEVGRCASTLEKIGRRVEWIVEPFCGECVDITVALLHGKALAAMMLRHSGDFLDFNGKYSADGAKHLCPAPIGDALTEQLFSCAERAFLLCGCRDWARVDFLLDGSGDFFFLEVNGVPGFTETSFFPDCAIASDLGAVECLKSLLEPALRRHRSLYR